MITGPYTTIKDPQSLGKHWSMKIPFSSPIPIENAEKIRNDVDGLRTDLRDSRVVLGHKIPVCTSRTDYVIDFIF